MDAQKSNSYTERVQCPYCHEIIEAPNQSGVTFLCPHCNKELMTFDKTYKKRNSQQQINTHQQRCCYKCFEILPENSSVCPNCGTDNDSIWSKIDNPFSTFNQIEFNIRTTIIAILSILLSLYLILNN